MLLREQQVTFPAYSSKDSLSPVVRDPMPSKEDVDWILKEVGNYMGPGKECVCK